MISTKISGIIKVNNIITTKELGEKVFVWKEGSLMGRAKQKVSKEEKRLQKVNFFRSIRFKIIAAVLLPVCFIVVLGVVCYKKASEGIISSFQESSEQTVAVTGEYFNFMLATTLKDYNALLMNEQLIAYLSGTLSGFPEQMASIYNSNRTDFIKRLTGAVFLNNIYIVSDISDSITTTYPPTLSLYSMLASTKQGKEAAEDPNSYFWFGTMPQLDEAYGTSEDQYALRLLRKFKKTDAFLVVDISRKAVMDVLNNLELGEGAVWGLVTRDGSEVLTQGEGQDVMFSGNVFSGTSAFQSLAASEEQQMVEEITYEGKQYLFLGTKVSNTGLSVCAMIPMTTITALANGIQKLTLWVVLIASLIAILVGLVISQGIDSTIKTMLRQINQVAKGDLTVTIHTKRNDEFSVLAQDLSRMIAHTKHLIQRVEGISGQLLSAAEQVTGKADDYVELAANIKQAAGGIEAGVTKQAEDTGQCLQCMDELSGQIDLLTGETSQMGEVVTQADETIQTSLFSMEELKEKAMTTSRLTGTVILTMENLEEKSKNIGGIVQTIKSIASQTNVLSLNASIEAARAGEAGLGFAVVAREIQALSAQSTASAKQIYDILEEIQVQMKEAVKAVQKAESAVSEQEEAVRGTADSFGQMKVQMGLLTTVLSELLSNAGEMETARSATLEAVKSISAVAITSAESSSSVAKAANQQFSLVTDFSDTAKQLLDYAGNLEESIKSFKVR